MADGAAEKMARITEYLRQELGLPENPISVEIRIVCDEYAIAKCEYADPEENGLITVRTYSLVC